MLVPSHLWWLFRRVMVIDPGSLKATHTNTPHGQKAQTIRVAGSWVGGLPVVP
jgi:hypothetical protein